MCEYSLHAVASRPAVANDKVAVSKFPRTTSIGLRSLTDECTTAVCLSPGTQLVFEAPVKRRGFLWNLLYIGRSFPKEATFTQKGRADFYHDGLEFPDGTFVLIQKLRLGQKARVVQLPVDPKKMQAGDTSRLRELYRLHERL
jgi:hypothetical protein